jgi:pimeloyl-ACP methyl ester carboxylesterase/DNA-binding SARP family transcriptional activator
LTELPILCLLGRAAIATGKEHAPLRIRPKALALLARLALAGRPLERATLADELFPEVDDRLAVLRWHLSHLRSVLPAALRDALHTDRSVASFIGPCDVSRFRARVQDVIDHPEDDAAEEVLALYRGDLCEGLAVNTSATFDTWLYVEQEGLRRRFRQAVIPFARRAIEAGTSRRALSPLSRLVQVDPYYEEAHVLLIEAYEASGERETARSTYERYARIVREDLLAEPRPTVAERYGTRVAEGRRLPLDDLITLRDVTLHVVDWPGDEPTILAIHGSIGSGYTLTALAERLAPEYRFVAMDLRGHGLSDKPPGDYRLEHFVADVVELVRALGLRHHVLLGFSAGGAIAAHAALLTGARGLVLLDGVVGPRSFTQRSAAKVVKNMGDALELRFPSYDAYLDAWRKTRISFSGEGERTAERVARYQLARLPDGTYRRQGLRQALEDEWTSIIDADNLAALSLVRCPVLVVQGAAAWIGDEPYVAEAVADAQVRAAPNAELFVARRSSHPMLIRDPEPEMVERIKEFMRGSVVSITRR